MLTIVMSKNSNQKKLTLPEKFSRCFDPRKGMAFLFGAR